MYFWHCCGAKSSHYPEAEINTVHAQDTLLFFLPCDSPHPWQYLGRLLVLELPQLVNLSFPVSSYRGGDWSSSLLSVEEKRPASYIARSWRIIWDCSENA